MVTIGNVDSALQAGVDRTGTVTAWAGRWRLGWWVRASDRWHVPPEETGTAVSQRLVDGTPVVETGVRVPGGQVVHRVFAALAGGAEWIVVEVENRSREPVAVALAVAAGARISYRDGVVHVGRRPAVVLPREPSRFAGEPGDGGSERWPGDLRRGVVAAVFPLPHTAAIRAAVPMAAARRIPVVDLASLPPADRVANGWKAHTEPPGSLRAVLPDDAAAAAMRADRAELLITHDDPDADLAAVGLALEALDRCGHHDTVRRALLPILDGELRRRRWDGAGQVLVAAAGHHRRTGTPLPDDLVGPVAEAAHRLARLAPRDPWTAPAQLAAAALLDTAGQPEAAAACRDLAAAAAPGPGPLAPLPPPSTAAGRLVAAVDALVREAEAGRVELLAHLPDDWLGQPVEVHGAPSHAGPVSFAVRWHGPRPALLWEVDARGAPPVLAAPGLDPLWSTSEPRGEALLAPVEPAGGLPKVVAPLGSTGVSAGEAPDEGSFT